MPKLMSLTEFQTRSTYGSVEDAYVYGLGLVQRKPSIAVSRQPASAFYPFASANHMTKSTYLTSSYELFVSPDTSGYRKELAKGIQEAIRLGPCFLNPQTGEMETIPANASLQVEVDANENVCIQLDYMENLTAKSQRIQVPLELAMYNLQNPSSAGPVSMGNPETGGLNIDYLELSKKARSFSGSLISINNFIRPAVNHFTRHAGYGKHAMYGEVAIPIIKKRLFGGKYVIHGGSIWLDKKVIAKLDKITRGGNRIVGGGAIFFGFVDMYYNGFKPSNVTHTTMAVLSLIPQTRIIATVYFTVDGGMGFTKGGGIGERMDRYFIDQGHTWYDAVDDILKAITPTHQPQFIDSPMLIKSPVNQPILIYLT